MLSCNNDLQMEINSAPEQIYVSAKTSANSTAAPHFSSATTRLSILDELADRKCRCKNLILYNFPENSDHQADKAKFLELTLTLNLYNQGYSTWKKNDEKRRPLRFHWFDQCNQCNDVYIVADKTKYERNEQMKLVDELKSKGERNSII